MTFDPLKEGKTGGSITKNDRCVDLNMMHICTKIWKKIQEMWPAERTQNFHQNMTFDPIKRRNTGGSNTKKQKGRVDLDYGAHLYKILKAIRQEMWPAERTQDFHQNMTFGPYKRRYTGCSITKKQ